MRRTPLLITLLFFVVLSCGALDWADRGLKLLSEKKQGKQVIFLISDARGREFSIISDSVPMDAELRKIQDFHELSRKWTTIRIAGMTFVIYPSEIEVNIKISDLTYQGVDLVPYISAGIGLYYANSLSYNFRLSVNQAYPRVQGLYESEEALCKAILDALRSVEPAPKKPAVITPAPATPEQKAQPAPVETATIPAIAIPPSPAKPVPVPETTPEPVRAIIQAPSENYQSLQDELNLLRSENQALRLDLERLRKAVLTLENLGIFGSVRAVSVSGIERILALKKEKPSLMQDEVVEILRKEDIKMTSYEVFLVFSVYLNEFR